MTMLALADAFSARTGSGGVERAVGEAERLLLAVESYGLMLAELGAIDLPSAARAEPMQMRAVASLYLASTLEVAGLIEATDGLARLARSGALAGDLGEAAPLVAEFWNGRSTRTSTEERLALFARLFGAPAGPVDAVGSVNDMFEEMLLDLCDAIIESADHGSQRRVRAAGVRLAENIAAAASEFVLMMARDIITTLSQAIAILSHPQVRTVLMARTLWDAVAAIDRRFRRRARPTLSYLRRGRAGMPILEWLADALDSGETDAAMVGPDDTVIDAAINWVDETLAILRAEESTAAAASPGDSATRHHASSGQPQWLELAR
jgi:hypothetical protein